MYIRTSRFIRQTGNMVHLQSPPTAVADAAAVAAAAATALDATSSEKISILCRLPLATVR